jgi:gamma-glutamyltranspeptidase
MVQKPFNNVRCNTELRKGGCKRSSQIKLALLKGFDLSDLDPVGGEFVHLVTECSKLAFADREKYYGDPNFVVVQSRVAQSQLARRL